MSKKPSGNPARLYNGGVTTAPPQLGHRQVADAEHVVALRAMVRGRRGDRDRIARDAGIPRSTLDRWVLGRSQMPADRIEAVARAIGYELRLVPAELVPIVERLRVEPGGER